jgi:hypothetical protein
VENEYLATNEVNRSRVAVLMVFVGGVEDNLARRVGRVDVEADEADFVAHSEEHGLF